MNIMTPEGAVARCSFKACSNSPHGESMLVLLQDILTLVNNMSFRFNILLLNDLEQRNEILGILGQKVSLSSR